MKTFKAEKNDVFTTGDPIMPSCVWVYRGNLMTSLEDIKKDLSWGVACRNHKKEIELTPAQVNAWAAAIGIKIEWPDEQPATCKPDLQVQPLSFREQAAIAAMTAIVKVDGEYGTKTAQWAWDLAEKLEAERVARGGGK